MHHLSHILAATECVRRELERNIFDVDMAVDMDFD